VRGDGAHLNQTLIITEDFLKNTDKKIRSQHIAEKSLLASS
jgi:hypothetical protein